MMKRKYVKTLRGVRIPTWALCYLVNGDDSALDEDDKATVDAWVERTRDGGRIDVCCPDGEPYFCRYPAFGFACDVEDCDVVVDMSPWYPRNPCMRFGQSRFGPVKRTALDGKAWWCMYDYHDNAYVTWYRFKRRSCSWRSTCSTTGCRTSRTRDSAGTGCSPGPSRRSGA